MKTKPVPPIQRSGPVRKDGVFSFEKKEKPKRDIGLWNDIWRKEQAKYERV
jgi:hypothetical protein